MSGKRLLHAGTCFALVVLCAVASPAAFAQAWPVKPVRVIVPHPAGTPVDLAIRLFADRVKDGIGQPLVIENRYGASGGVGAEIVANAPADAYTLMATIDATMTVIPMLYAKFPVDVTRDFTMVAMLGDRGTQVLVVPADSKATSVRQFLDQAKASRERQVFAQAEPGTPGHLIGVALARQTGIDAEVVSYRGPVAAIQEVMAGRAAASFSPTGSVVPFVRSGKVRALAITGDAKNEFLPELPTFAEAGAPEVRTRFNWIALFAKVGTPREPLERLNAEFRRISAQPETKAQLARIALVPGTQTIPQLREQWEADLAYWRDIAPRLGIRLE